MSSSPSSKTLLSGMLAAVSSDIGRQGALMIHTEEVHIVGRVRVGCVGGQAQSVPRAPARVDQAGLLEMVEQPVVKDLLATSLLPAVGNPLAASDLLREHFPQNAALKCEQDVDRRSPAVDGDRPPFGRSVVRGVKTDQRASEPWVIASPTGGELSDLLQPAGGFARQSRASKTGAAHPRCRKRLVGCVCNYQHSV